LHLGIFEQPAKNDFSATCQANQVELEIEVNGDLKLLRPKP
jgi:hypothetical protein